MLHIREQHLEFSSVTLSYHHLSSQHLDWHVLSQALSRGLLLINVTVRENSPTTPLSGKLYCYLRTIQKILIFFLSHPHIKEAKATMLGMQDFYFSSPISPLYRISMAKHSSRSHAADKAEAQAFFRQKEAASPVIAQRSQAPTSSTYQLAPTLKAL